MGKRSGIIEHEKDLAKLSLVQLDEEIGRCRRRLAITPSDRQRKSFESRIHWLERFRTLHHRGA